MALPPQGIPVPPAVERPARDPLAMATVGRLVHERGVDRLLRACGQLMGPWSLLVAGTGPEQESLEDLAQKLGLASRIRWLGPIARSEITALWQDVDVVVAPSRRTPTWVERPSSVILEAMAHGVAPGVSAEGALPEIVGDSGIVVNSDEDLLVALQELVMDRDRRAALGRAGRARIIDRYGDAAIAGATSAFWHEVLTRAHAGRPEPAAT
jgi:glycosyltransferase involved in cell wall biosynthesis